MNNRLKQIRKANSMTQDAFAAEIGATRGMVAKYETGLVVPDKSMQMLICSKFNVNYDWLSDGIGEMTASRPFVPELMRILRQHPALKAVLESLVDEMDAEDWAALNSIARKFVEQKQKKDG